MILYAQGTLCLVMALILAYQGKPDLVVLYASMSAVCLKLGREVSE